MKIVKPYARITNFEAVSQGIKVLKVIEYIGRVSHRSEEKQTENSWEKFIRSVVINHGDWSITEHISVTVDATVDRGITHEWVRHRIGAYTQESTRFVNYAKGEAPGFIVPKDLPEILYESWYRTVEWCGETYRNLIERGVSPQIARSVLPNSLASRLIVTYNLRNWRHFLLMRTTKETHPQMREVTIPLLKEFQEKIPILFEDILPEAKQSENLKKGR